MCVLSVRLRNVEKSVKFVTVDKSTRPILNCSARRPPLVGLGILIMQFYRTVELPIGRAVEGRATSTAHSFGSKLLKGVNIVAQRTSG